MCHQPFETWLLEGKELTREEQELLQSHLDGCAKCSQLHQAWQSVQHKLKSSSMVSPAPGFIQRWQVELSNRLQQQQLQQMFRVRRFFLYLGTAIIITLILLIAFVLTSRTPVDWMVGTLNQILEITSWLSVAQNFTVSLIQALPPIFPAAMWIIVTSGFSILALIWVVSLWKISNQGEVTK